MVILPVLLCFALLCVCVCVCVCVWVCLCFLIVFLCFCWVFFLNFFLFLIIFFLHIYNVVIGIQCFIGYYSFIPQYYIPSRWYIIIGILFNPDRKIFCVNIDQLRILCATYLYLENSFWPNLNINYTYVFIWIIVFKS